jgi:hypothetical protein
VAGAVFVVGTIRVIDGPDRVAVPVEEAAAPGVAVGAAS